MGLVVSPTNRVDTRVVPPSVVELDKTPARDPKEAGQEAGKCVPKPGV